MEDESRTHEEGAHVAGTDIDTTGRTPDDGVTHESIPRPLVQPSEGAGRSQDESTFDMNSLSNSLPTYGYRGQQVYHGATHAPQGGPLQYHYASGPFPGASAGQMPSFTQQIPLHYQGQRMYGSYQTNPAMAQSQFPNQMYVANPQMLPGPGPAQFQNFQYGPMFSPVSDNQFGRTGPYHQMQGRNMGHSSHMFPTPDFTDQQQSIPSPPGPTAAALRGPPRKPKQSGHALWVGNLPPGANILDLKDHFARDATDDIESVFLISKSNCAFVNYKSEDSCTAAMSRFHDSRFQGVRLVCRLRRGITPLSIAGAAKDLSDSAVLLNSDPNSDTPTAASDDAAQEKETQLEPTPEDVDAKVKERFFIIKSLTIEDLERSLQTGVWATQTHNEVALNKAYQAAENVYLIFSANKSGEYFGYARMESAIDDEAAALIASETPMPPEKQVMEMQASLRPALPMTIPTPATATAPVGHIIDDSARGTIFWEAESANLDEQAKLSSPIEPDEAGESEQVAPSPSSISANLETSSTQTTFGKPFKISWQSTDRLPFYRTRGLRNPWNTNREVKIARDGTEIEPIVGRKLIDMFGTQPAVQLRGQPPYPGPMMMGGGFGHNHQSYGRGY